MSPMKQQETNIVLKKIESKDIQKIRDWKNDSELMRLVGAQPVKSSLAEVKQWAARANRDPNQVLFGIYLKQGMEMIGVVRLMFIDWVSGHAEMGIYIGESDARGRGLGYETVSLIRDFAFQELKLNKMYLKVTKSNLAAIRTYKKCKLKVDGVMREHFRSRGKMEDMLMMSVLKSDLRKAKK